MNTTPGDNDGCECLDCQIEGGLVRFDLDEVLCYEHGEPECVLCAGSDLPYLRHSADDWDC